MGKSERNFLSRSLSDAVRGERSGKLGVDRRPGMDRLDGLGARTSEESLPSRHLGDAVRQSRESIHSGRCFFVGARKAVADARPSESTSDRGSRHMSDRFRSWIGFDIRIAESEI